MIYIFDASAAMRYLDDEAGADRVEEILHNHIRGASRLLISAIQWGEIAGILFRRAGIVVAQNAMLRLANLGFEAVAVTAEQAIRSAVLRAVTKLPYADAFPVALAEEHPQSVLVTADFDFKLVESITTIEFLPSKQPR